MTHDEAIRNVLQTDRERVLVDTFSVAIRDLHADYARRETQLAVAAAQAGADHAVRVLTDRGLLLTPGKPVTVKTVLRDSAGQISGLVEETIEVHETRTTDAAPAVPAEFWQQ